MEICRGKSWLESKCSILCRFIEFFMDNEEQSHDGMVSPRGPHGSAKALWGSRSPNDLWEMPVVPGPCAHLVFRLRAEQEASLLPTRVTHVATVLSMIAPSPLRATTWIGQLPQ